MTESTPSKGAGVGIVELLSERVIGINSLGGNVMGISLRVRKWGNSLAVRIHKAIADHWGVSEGPAI